MEFHYYHSEDKQFYKSTHKSEEVDLGDEWEWLDPCIRFSHSGLLPTQKNVYIVSTAIVGHAIAFAKTKKHAIRKARYALQKKRRYLPQITKRWLRKHGPAPGYDLDEIVEYINENREEIANG